MSLERLQTRSAQSRFFASLILYEDNHLILVYKPHGTAAQPDQSGDPSLLDFGRAYLIERYQKAGAAYLAAPHRLDRPAAGLCVLAKTTKAMQRLSRAFQQKQVQKLYLAIVEGRLQTSKCYQKLAQYLRKNASQNKSYICEANTPNAKLAQLQYRSLAQGERYSIVLLQTQTGRHHQIRCQLAGLGHPIRGDQKYGAKRISNPRAIDLYAVALAFPMPVRRESGKKSPQPTLGPQCSQHPQPMLGPQPSQGPQYRKRPAPIAEIPASYAWKSAKGSAETLQSLCLPWEPQHPQCSQPSQGPHPSQGPQCSQHPQPTLGSRPTQGSHPWRLCTPEVIRELTNALPFAKQSLWQ